MGALSPKETIFWQVQRMPSWGHNFVATLPSQRQRNRQYTVSKNMIFRVVNSKKKDNKFPLNKLFPPPFLFIQCQALRNVALVNKPNSFIITNYSRPILVWTLIILPFFKESASVFASQTMFCLLASRTLVW